MKRGRNQRRRQGMNINRALDSNGPDVRIRGTANQIYDKYLALARDATSAGDRVKAENYLQHAEHYFRLIRSIQQSQQPQAESYDGDAEQPSVGSGDRAPQRNRADADEEGTGRETAKNGKANGADAQPEGEAEKPQEKRPPRRRRTRKPAADAAESDAKEDAEAAAS